LDNDNIAASKNSDAAIAVLILSSTSRIIFRKVKKFLFKVAKMRLKGESILFYLPWKV
jgi:hypothetical protein